MKYLAKMNGWTHDRDYPISKTFIKKKTAMAYIKRALNIYPYAKITLYKYTNDGKQSVDGTYKISKKGRIIKG